MLPCSGSCFCSWAPQHRYDICDLVIYTSREVSIAAQLLSPIAFADCRLVLRVNGNSPAIVLGVEACGSLLETQSIEGGTWLEE